MERLREELGECTSEQWQRAGVIFQEICRLCDHKGSKGGMGHPYPRACKYCNRFGHSTQFCKARKQAEIAMEAREVEKIMEEEREWRAKMMGAPQLDTYWQMKFKWQQERYDAACDAGMEGCEQEQGPCSFYNRKLCESCERWNAWMRKRDIEVPWTGGDAPNT